MKTVHSADSAALPLGTQIGAWRVVGQHGNGSYGVVYRVEKVGQENEGPFALKVAKHPLDPRFEREWELLSRIRHPQVPRFEARGWVTLPGGVAFPYVVMEWVEGVPLYEWAARERRTSRQVLRVLAQVARALEATHAVEGVHRDVKGDNVLVRAEDGKAVLMDFGSGYFRGAPVLTKQPPPPGTERYWSPECLRFQMKWLRHPTMRYEAGPADDLYALGVTAYRLVTGVYPPPWKDFVETEEGYQLVPPKPVPVETRVTVCPELAALINKLLSDEPSARGSAAEVAAALERAENTTGANLDQPITPVSAQVLREAALAREVRAPKVGQSQEPAQAPTLSEFPEPERASRGSVPRGSSPRHELRWSRRLMQAAGILLVAAVGWVANTLSGVEWAGGPEPVQDAIGQDAGAVGLGDEMPAVPVAEGTQEPERGGMGSDRVQKPFPGQHRPPCQKPAVEIHGGCWVRVGDAAPSCGARYYEWNKGCYLPVFELPRTPASVEP
ncbi:MAG TPA: serine/threonine-protein kinase [Myxococcaceae bacterium]